jgi:membrane protein implicated in regulation of membrane protease activity
MFGPWLVIGHRFLDNLFLFKIRIPTEGIKGAMLTLIWFWIPAHTVTFSLPAEWQITLAAVWSFVLGLLLSLFVKKPVKTMK